MLRNLFFKKGQVIPEYALLIAIIIAVLSSMTVYVKRTLQARLRDAQRSMSTMVNNQHKVLNGVGNVYVAYEPYYESTTADITSESDALETLQGGDSSGLYKRVSSEENMSERISVQLPPKDAK